MRRNEGMDGSAHRRSRKHMATYGHDRKDTIRKSVTISIAYGIPFFFSYLVFFFLLR